MNTSAQDSKTIPIKPKILHRFYEPLILLKALNVEMKDSADFVDHDNAGCQREPEQTFQAFVYKLAHVCDSVKGDRGGTITSVMVLEPRFPENEIVEYRFASNNRTTNELEKTSEFMSSLLGHLRTATFPNDEPAMWRRLLCLILGFNRSRIASYLTAIRKEVQSCLTKCSITDDDEDKKIAATLRRILALLEFNWNEYAPDTECRCISRRAREIRENGLQSSLSCWPEMWHMMNRLASYAQDVEFFILAKREWPELFENFRVRFLSSSVPIRGPVRPKSMKAEGIVGRMTDKPKEIEIFRGFVQDLQLTDLDARIRAEYTKDTFCPIVHSEILLLDNLERSGPITPDRFFNGWMFIGSSKPLCRLCQYYFQEHHSGVGHRKSHQNLYPSWRVPDVLLSQGAEGEEKRQIMINRMMVRIRRDAFDLIRKRVHPMYRNHDSFTSSMKITLGERWTTGSSASDVASRMGGLTLEDPEDDEQGGATLAKTDI
ncbi:hypothetical protein CSUB01_08825 [Colletotrichum sublineola]|uniref:C2H2-type domain-containing protein n=1 Tax=Colletotrichum sublineola TaxID=1173701 RepID=A0A066XZQ2_COLSU|nr:hypothetical protein CSUB01_08825 [Colletotrichum sublineola]